MRNKQTRCDREFSLEVREGLFEEILFKLRPKVFYQVKSQEKDIPW